MSKVADVRVLEAAQGAADVGLPESVQVALTDIAATAREGLLALSVAATDTSVVLGGRKVAVRRPRARTLDGQEVHLESFAAFADDDQLDTLVFERMLAGLATRRLGVGDRIARSLSTTNAAELMISVARDTTRRVKRWRDGTMVKRSVAAGLLNAERNFRGIKGCIDMPILVAALTRHIHGDVTPTCENQEVA